MNVRIGTTARTAILGVIGLTLGIVGFSAYFKTDPLKTLGVKHEPRGEFASAACNDVRSSEEEIFFLSCGGIY